jgi:hypothetical protein
MGGAFMNKTHGLTYNVKTENLKQLILLAFELTDTTGMEPANLVLPDGREIPWNNYAAHQFVAEGRISEAEFIEMSMNP